MDPIYYQLATNRKQDNVRRSGENLQVQKANEKEKATTAGKLDDSELSADVGGMSGDDLLGSMDPDLFGSGGGAQAFQQTWEEILSEEEDERFEDGEEEEGDGEPQRPPQDEVQEEEGRKPLEGFELKAPTQAEEVERPPVAEGKLPSVSPEDGMREAPQPEEKAPEPAPAAAPPSPDKVKIKIDRPTFNSLLDLTGGFLIAEETLPELGDDEPGSPASGEDLLEVAPDLVELLGKLIVGDSASPGYRKLQHLLARFGKGVLRTCLEQESRVFLLPQGRD